MEEMSGIKEKENTDRKVKVRVEISEDRVGRADEVVIFCSELSKEVNELRRQIENSLRGNEIALYIGDVTYFVTLSDILFFETDGDKIKVHTRDNIYMSDEKLYRLEQQLPRYFARASKSCIVNSAKISSICRSVTGNAEVGFFGNGKRAYVSRMYFKALKNLIYETRILGQ